MTSLFAKRLRQARTEAGLTQEKLGVLAGIDEMSASARMNQYEREKHMPDISMVERIAKVLNLPLAYFYAEPENEAELLRSFHRLKIKDKKRVLDFLKEIQNQE